MSGPPLPPPELVVALPPGLVNSNTGVFLCDVAALVTMIACVPTLSLYWRKRRWGDLVRNTERGRPEEGGGGRKLARPLRRARACSLCLALATAPSAPGHTLWARPRTCGLGE